MALTISIGIAKYETIADAAAAKPWLVNFRLHGDGTTILADDPADNNASVIAGELINPFLKAGAGRAAVEQPSSWLPGIFGALKFPEMTPALKYALIALAVVVALSALSGERQRA